MDFELWHNKLSLMKFDITDLQKELKKLKKQHEKNPPRPKKKLSGIAAPIDASAELCAFMGMPEGTKISRTAATKYLHQHATTHGLNDARLLELLHVDKLEKRFDIAKHLKWHFLVPQENGI